MFRGGEGGEVVRIVVAGVVWVGVCAEAAVEDCGWGVDVDFSRAGSTGSQSAFAGLCANVADGAVEGRVHEFGVIFVHDFRVNESGVFGLLAEGSFEVA